MTLLVYVGRIITAMMTGRIRRIPDAEFAVIDTWLEEDEYRAGFPCQWNETAGWRWWRGH